jgi:hypothetical protein
VYNQLINGINQAMGTATKEELELAVRLNVVKLLNVEDLIMELKNVKVFAAEVGLTEADLAGLNDMQIAKAVCDAIDPEKGYSTEFIAWYDAVPDGAFDAVDGVSGGTAVIDAAAIDTLITHVNGLSKVQEFKDVLTDAEIASLFEGLDCSKFKLAPQFKKAIIEHLESIKYNPPAAAASPAAEIDKVALAKAIAGCSVVDELIAIIEANQTPFEGLEINDTELEPIKAALIKHLGVDLTPPAAAPAPTNKLADLLKKKTAAAPAAPAPTSDLVIPFDPNAFDPNVIYTQAEGLQIGQLRKFWKQVMELSPVAMDAAPGMKKDLMMDQIATGLIAISENGPKKVDATPPAAAPAECALEINPTSIKTATDANDKDSLIAMCDAAGIKLNALQKRSVPTMAKLLNEKFPVTAAAPATGKGKLKLTAAAPAESYLAKVFGLVESMTLAKADEAAICEAVIPVYAAGGKSPNKLIVKTRVKQLMEIVAVEHGLKEKK